MNSRYLSKLMLGASVVSAISLGAFSALAQSTAAAKSPSINVLPAEILQGDPIMITLSGTTQLPSKSAPSLYFFLYKGVPTAFYGIDLYHKTGTTSISVTLKNGVELTKSFFIKSRIEQTESLPIPPQLGGNSVSNQAAVVSQLSKDNADLSATYSRKDKALWTTAFAFPVGAPDIITDTYGYNRDSGANTIVHKGADFRASVGTSVYAANRGVVRVAKNYAVYGNTVIVDHGLGVLSMYMHLSKISVIPGQLVEKGQLVGLAGDTGYSEGSHLHLTIRIGGISIDPVAFYALFGLKPQEII